MSKQPLTNKYGLGKPEFLNWLQSSVSNPWEYPQQQYQQQYQQQFPQQQYPQRTLPNQYPQQPGYNMLWNRINSLESLVHQLNTELNEIRYNLQACSETPESDSLTSKHISPPPFSESTNICVYLNQKFNDIAGTELDLLSKKNIISEEEVCAMNAFNSGVINALNACYKVNFTFSINDSNRAKYENLLAVAATRKKG